MFLPNTGYAFETFIEQTGGIRTKERLFEAFVQAMAYFGYDRLNFSVIQDLQLPGNVLGFGLISTYPPDWQRLYLERQFGKIDPVLKSASALNLPFTWRDLDRHYPLTRKQRRFFDLAAEAGLHNGIGIPFNGARTQIAGIALATSDKSTDHLKNRDLLSAFANHFYIVFKRLANPIAAIQSTLSPLSPRETEILQLIASGKTDGSVADMLSISENTVSYFLRNIYYKLNATNRVQAIVIAIAAGLIDL